MFSICSTSIALAVPLSDVWAPRFRNDIKVYLCITRFAQQFPDWDLNVLRANVRNALDTWNTYNGVDLSFSWQGDLTCSRLDCTGAGDPTACKDDEWPTSNGEPEGNLQEFTNAKIGVAFNPSAHRYLIAWTAAEPWQRIHTILGDGLNYWSSTRVAHSGANSYYGPAAVYAEGKYVIAWTLTNDTRRIAYRTSSTGYPADQWSAVRYVQYKGTNDYGSMWEPALAYNANRGVFLIAWTNWQVTWTNDDKLGRVRICVSDDPATQPFGNCDEYYMASNSPPAIVCHSTANECILAWTNHIGYYDHHISYRKGRVNSDSGVFELTGTGYYFISGGSTRLAPDLGYGNGYWMLSFRDNNSVGANYRMAEAAWPYWSNWTSPDSPLQVSPTVQFGSSWNKFAYYYIKR